MPTYPHEANDSDNRPSEAEREANRDRERRERQQQTRQLDQQQAARKKTLVITSKSLNVMAQTGQDATGAKARRQIQENKLRKLNRESGDFAEAGPRATVGYLVIVTATLVVIGVNSLLIHAPVQYLVGSAFEDPNAWQARFATLLIPVALLVFEIYISLQLWRAVQEETGEVKRWHILGLVMVAFTPLMIFATTIVREDWWVAHNLLLSLALMLLAGVTDAAIVFGGAQIHTSQAFIYYITTRWAIQQRINHHEQSYRRVGLKAERAYAQYVQVLNDYNANHQPPIAPGPFSETTRTFLNEWFGEEVILPPQRPRLIANDEIDPGAATPVKHFTPPPVNPPAAAAPPGASEAVESERDYYRDLLAGQVRRNERELRAD